MQENLLLFITARVE